MNRGIIFSIDAALALIIVVMLAGWLAQYSTTAEERSNVFEETQREALDEAIAAFYAGIGGIPDEEIPDTAEAGKCFIVYDLDPNNDPQGEMAVLQSMQVCAER